MDLKVDAVVIGAGPAGASFATYYKRFNHSLVVIDNGKSNLLLAKSIDNYYGFKGITGKELYETGIKNLKENDIDVINDEVVHIDYMKSFIVKTTKDTFIADNIIIATGKAHKKVNIKGLDNLNGVSYCAICDGFLYRGKRLGLIGSSFLMEHELDVLSRFTNDITIFTDGLSFISDKYNVDNSKILEAKGFEKIESIVTQNNTYNLDGLFIATGYSDTFTLIRQLGLKVDNNGDIITDNYQTNFKGIYAIGDAISGIKQVSKAVSDGANLAYLLK